MQSERNTRIVRILSLGEPSLDGGFVIRQLSENKYLIEADSTELVVVDHDMISVQTPISDHMGPSDDAARMLTEKYIHHYDDVYYTFTAEQGVLKVEST